MPAPDKELCAKDEATTGSDVSPNACDTTTATVCLSQTFVPVGDSTIKYPSKDLLVQRLLVSQLIERDRLHEYAARLTPESPADADLSKGILDQLVADGWLTRWQAECLLTGARQQFTVGRYRLLDKLGEGGMGAVYRASHTLIDRQVALKQLRPELAGEPKAVRRFLVEAQACVKLDHPNIVATFDVDQADGVVYLTMALIDGVDLDRHVREHGPLPIESAISVIRQAAEGLQYAYQKGIVHRDIKPHNLMIDRQGRVRILDMGLARLHDEPATESTAVDDDIDLPAQELAAAATERLTRSGAVVGTIAYIAPEQAQDSRNADIRSDIYSLGCTFYYLLAGKSPFEGKTAGAMLQNHFTGAYVPISVIRADVPIGIERVLSRMMARAPEDRYQLPLEIIHDLAAVAIEADRSKDMAIAPADPAAPSSEAAPPKAQSHRWLVWHKATAPLVILLAALGLVLLYFVGQISSGTVAGIIAVVLTVVPIILGAALFRRLF